MLQPKKLTRLFLMLCVLALLVNIPSFGRRSIGTRASSDYGQAGGQSQWEWTPVAHSTVNGISVTTETVCSGSIDTSFGSPICDSTSAFVFLYQIPSGPNNLVVTFSGLSRFAFGNAGFSGFGILRCDPSPAQNMLCTDLTDQQVSSLNIGWDAIGGDLILTVPSVPVGGTLTFYIAEQPGSQSQGPLIAPTISLGGAVVVPPSLTFGSQESKTTGPSQTITLANTADFSMALNITDTSKPNNFVSAESCSTLAPGENCALFLAFSPTTSGNLSETFAVTDDTPIANEAISLNGFGTAGGVTLSPPNLVFGSHAVGTTSDPLSVTITNAKSNSQPLQVIGIVSAINPTTGVADFTETDNCSTAVAPGSSCTFQITFSPTISGLIESSITITDDSADGSHTIELIGNGTEANTATANPSSLNFSNQTSGTTSTARTVTVTNSGAISINTVAVNPTAGFSMTADNCSSAGPLDAGKNCTLSVAFQPAAGSHSYTGTLTIANDAIGGTLVIPLNGTSVAAPAATPTFSPGAGTYTSIQTVTISDTTPGATIYYTNDGTTPTISSTIYSGPIAVANTETIKAIASASEYTTSAVASALYTINLPPPSFTITGTAATIVVGATSTSTVTVTPVGGFTGSVTLTATISSGPTGAVNVPTLNFGSTSPVSVTGTNAAKATLTITTTPATRAALRDPNRMGSGGLEMCCVSLAFVVLFGIPMRDRKSRIVLGLLFLMAATNGIVACGGGGGGGSSSHGNTGTTPGSYTISVTGSSGSLTETGTVALTVN